MATLLVLFFCPLFLPVDLFLILQTSVFHIHTESNVYCFFYISLRSRSQMFYISLLDAGL